MARKQSNSPEDDLFSVKVKPYDEALAELKEAIERQVKKDVKYRRRQSDIEMPPAYRFIRKAE